MKRLAVILGLLIAFCIISCTHQVQIPDGFIKGKLGNYRKKSSEKDVYLTYYCPANATLIINDSTFKNKLIRKLHTCDFAIDYDFGFSCEMRVIPNLNCYLLFKQQPSTKLTSKQSYAKFDDFVKGCNQDRSPIPLKYITNKIDTSNKNMAIINIEYTTKEWRDSDSIRYVNQEIILYKDYEFNFSMVGSVPNQQQADSLHKLSQIILGTLKRED